MAIVQREMWDSGSDGAAKVEIVFDDANGAISQIVWTVNFGTLTITIKQAGQPDIVRVLTTSGSLAVPAGYNMTPNPRGGWNWTGALYAEYNWHI